VRIDTTSGVIVDVYDDRGTRVPRIIAFSCALICLLVFVGAAQGSPTPVQISGRVMLMHGDDLRHNREVDAGVFLQHGRKLYPLPDSAEKYAGQTVTAHGSIRSGKVTLTEVAAAGSSTSSTGTSTSSASAMGAKRVAVILFNFSDNASQPFTPGSVDQTYFSSGSADRSVVNYYNEVSWGGVQVSGQTFGWHTISANSQTCDPSTWSSQADAAVKATGVDLTQFTNRTYVFPLVTACGWAGLAQVPGTQNWINGTPSVGVMAHELGHNFGLNHAMSESCTSDSGDRVAYSANCTTSEYGDTFDVMGSAGATYHLSDWHRAMIGLTNDIQMVSADGTYSLSPVENQSGTPHALRIPRGDGSYFDLELRQTYGTFDNFSPTSPVVNGVLVRKVGSYSTANKPMLIDTTPETPTFSDAALPAGRSFVDPTTGISVTTQSVSSSGAQVQIKVVPGADFTPPSVSIANVADGGSVTLPATIAVSASDNVGVAKVELYQGGHLYATSTTAPYTFPWVEGQSGPYTLYAVAYDTSGIVSASQTITVNATQSDTTAPSQPLDVRSIQNTQTSVSAVWAASSDNVGVVSYQLFQNGQPVATTQGTSFTYTGLTCGVKYAMSVAAVDAAGNSSLRRRLDAWTNACSGDTVSPTAPAAAQANVTGPTSVRVSWQGSTDNVGVTGYRIDRDGSTIATTLSTAFTDFSALAGASYSYTVTAYDAAGNRSGTSDPVHIVMPAADTQAPSIPSGVTASAVDSSTITVSWLPSTDDTAVAGYRVYRDGVLVSTTTQTGYRDSGLATGITYVYTVDAYDASGNASAQSGPVTATTDAVDRQAPTAPANLQASVLKGRKVKLVWSAASDNLGVTGYRIYRDGAAISTIPGTLSFTDSPGRGSHSYYVVALDAAGNVSADSNFVTVKT
jgi:fibronectin type 3 domain-containing protein